MSALRTWREAEGLTGEELADRLQTTAETVSRYERGTRMPVPAMMTRIWVVTGGAVAPNSFHHLPALRPTDAPAEATP